MVLRYTPPPTIEVQDDGYTVSSDIDIVNFGDNLTVTDNGYGKVTIEATSGGHDGLLHFGFYASSSDEWMTNETEDALSNKAPAIFPFTAELISITYTNFKNNTSIDVEIYRNGNNSGQKIYTWPIRNKRWAYKTNELSVTFAAGDRMSVFIKDRGTDTNKGIIQMRFKITDNSTGEGGGNL